MVLQTDKFNINKISSTPQQIALLSPDIYDCYALSSLTMSVEPENITPKKKSLRDIRKMPKFQFSGIYSDNRESDSHPKEYYSEGDR